MADHVTAEKLNFETIGRFLENRGYKIIELRQPWRHVVGEVLYENERLFLKLASTKGISERTKNEAAFLNNANTAWKRNFKSFRVPKIFDDGEYEGKYYFICEYVFGKPLADLKQNKSEITQKDLDKTAEVATEILNLSKDCLLPKDIEHFKDIWKERLWTVSKEWSREIKTDTKKLIQLIKDNINYLEIASSHGDFVPWSIYKTKEGQFYLVDSEAAQIAGPKFYDAAYFYHRVYTKLKRPDLAEIFLDKFKSINNFSEHEDKVFNLVLASRVIGGYFDAERDGITSLELNKELEGKTVPQ